MQVGAGVQRRGVAAGGADQQGPPLPPQVPPALARTGGIGWANCIN